MGSSFQASSLEKTIGLFTGFLIGVIPVAEYNIPVLITLMSVIFGIKHVDRESIKIAFPVVLYCVSMITLMAYHPGGWGYGEKLAEVMATIAIALLLILHL